MSEAGFETPYPYCPQCDYDLTGVVESWTTSCPLHCTCTECGFEIDLSELNGLGKVPGWFVAAAPGARGWIRRLPGTMLCMTVPFWPWRTLGPFALRHAFGPRQMLAWSAAFLVCLAVLAVMVLVVPIEGRNIARDIETRMELREWNREVIANREDYERDMRRLDGFHPPWAPKDPGVKSVLAMIDDPLAIPRGVIGDSLKRLWAIARLDDVPRGEGFWLSTRAQRSSPRDLIYSTRINDPWELLNRSPRMWMPLLVLPVAIVAMSGFGLRIPRGSIRVQTTRLLKLRLALLSSCILFPTLLLVGVLLMMNDKVPVKLYWTLSRGPIRSISVIPVLATSSGLLLLTAWWWGAFRMMQVRFALLTASFMVFLITTGTFVVIPGSFMLYRYLWG